MSIDDRLKLSIESRQEEILKVILLGKYFPDLVHTERGMIMTDYKLGEVESRFADIIWENEPLTTKELVGLCEKELNWKRTTTYTVLKKLSEHGIFRMKEKQVTSLISREDYYAGRSEQFVQETFQGSLPAFIAAFTKRKALSEKEIAEIQEMIDSAGR